MNKKGANYFLIGIAFLIVSLAILFADPGLSRDEFVGRHQYQLLSTNENTQIAQRYISSSASISSEFAIDDLFKFGGIFQESSDTGEPINPPCGDYQDYIAYSQPGSNCTPDFRNAYQAFFQNILSNYLHSYKDLPIFFTYSLNYEEHPEENKVRLLALASRELKSPVNLTVTGADFTIFDGTLGGFGDEKEVPCTTGECFVEVAEYYHGLYSKDGSSLPYVWGGESPYPIQDTIQLSQQSNSFFYGVSMSEYQPAPHSNEPTVEGFDCSGWLWWVGKHSEVDVFSQRLTADGYYKKGKEQGQEICSKDSAKPCYLPTIVADARPGDVLFFGTGSTATHIMLYTGDGEISHSSGSKGLVQEKIGPYYATDKSTKIIGVYRFQYQTQGIDSLSKYDEYGSSSSITLTETDNPATEVKNNNSQEQAMNVSDPEKPIANSSAQTMQLVGPTAWCDGTENLPKGFYAEQIESEAWNSQGQTYFDIAVQAGLEKGVDPALITTHMIYESSMGKNDECNNYGKSSLTGCTWYPSCSSKCACGGVATNSDLSQLQCTAKTDYASYIEATSGEKQNVGAYVKCNPYANDLDKLWKCILCVYQGNYAKDITNSGKPYFTKDGTCNYAENFKDTYCSWRKYYQDKGYDAASFSGPVSSVSNSYVTFTPYIDTTVKLNFNELDKVQEFVDNVQTNCKDNLRVCVQTKLEEFNAANSYVSITMNAEDDALAKDLVDQLLDCHVNGQERCICTLDINKDLNSKGESDFSVRLTDDNDVLFDGEEMYRLPFNPTNAYTGARDGHDYVEFLIDKEDSNDNYFEAEDWGDDYTWDLGIDNDNLDVALQKSNQYEYTWMKYGEDEKKPLLECRDNKNYFRFQAHFSFTQKIMNFSLYLNDSTGPKISQAKPKQIDCSGNPALQIQWTIPEGQDPAYDFIIQFEGDDESYQVLEAQKEFTSELDMLSSYQLYRKKTTTGGHNYYYIIKKLPSGASIEFNKTYKVTIVSRDHYLNNASSQTKEIFVEEPKEEQIANQLLGDAGDILTMAEGYLEGGFCPEADHRIIVYKNNSIESWRAEGSIFANSFLSLETDSFGNTSFNVTNFEPYPGVVNPETKEQLYKISNIPNVICIEEGSSVGKICAANSNLIYQLHLLSKELLVPQNKILTITQAFRTQEIQAKLWNYYNRDPKRVCDPYGAKTCPHMIAGAIDLRISENGRKLSASDQEEIMCEYGFVRYRAEDWHFEYGTWRWDQAEEKRKAGSEVCSY